MVWTKSFTQHIIKVSLELETNISASRTSFICEELRIYRSSKCVGILLRQGIEMVCTINEMKLRKALVVSVHSKLSHISRMHFNHIYRLLENTCMRYKTNKVKLILIFKTLCVHECTSWMPRLRFVLRE